MADILHQVDIVASPDQLFAALTEEDKVKAWWSEHSTIKPEVGSLASVSFYSNAVTFELRIKELEPSKSVVWAVEGGPPDWVNTDLNWSITQNNGAAILNLAHRGFASIEGNFASVNYTWGLYLTSLKFYLEKGEGMPHTDADMT